MAPKKGSSAKAKPRATRQKTTRGTKRKAAPALQLGRPKKARTVASKTPDNAINYRVLAGHKHPPWASLPYEVLLCVFQSAAYPLVDENWNRRETVRWLLTTSLVCKTFLEPALAALYHGPPLVHSQQYNNFTKLIASEKPRIVDYRSKVHQLDFEVNYSRFAIIAESLPELIARLPALKAFGLHQAADHPQPMNVSLPQTTRADLIYREEWIDSFANVNLTRFKFHSLFLHKQDRAKFEYWGLRQGELRSSFRMLEKLEIAGFSDGYKGERHLAKALQSLPNLKHLSFLRCTFIGGKMLEDDVVLFQLPSSLRSLEFVSCHELTSHRLSAALRLYGNDLRSLVLRSNKDTSLSFLSSLAEVCPVLERIEYDLSLYSTSLVLSHAEPTFDEILSEGEVPNWPGTLQRIELNQLRKWEVKTAEEFFTSLYNSASSLPDLRKLWITASVGSGWRERIAFREKIISPLVEIFSRSAAGLDAPPALNTPPSRRGSRGKTRQTLVHGKCDEVYVRVDNLRPAEEQLDESNFLDSEQSGDDNYVE